MLLKSGMCDSGNDAAFFLSRKFHSIIPIQNRIESESIQFNLSEILSTKMLETLRQNSHWTWDYGHLIIYISVD